MISKKRVLSSILKYLQGKENFVFLWNGKKDKDNRKSYIFTSPVKIIRCFKAHQVKPKLELLEKNLNDGHYAAGFLSYEAGLIFENILPENTKFKFPLGWFGIYEKPTVFDHQKNCFLEHDRLNYLLKEHNLTSKNNYQIKNIKPKVEKNEYVKNVEKIKNYIEEGNTYQVNYTFKHKFNWQGNPLDLFYHLCMKQSVSYAAYLKACSKDILSLSPELFFRRKKNYITVKPMKGTIDRGKNNIEDRNNRKNLEKSIKNRAENVMIVDLLRNDLGRISEIGTVKVSKLFELEKYETLFQMTSTIKSKIKSNITWYDIFKNILPSGSVTGAPKISTMKIINELEKEPRNIYTGNIGYISPSNESVFNVGIRTVLLDRNSKKGEMGIGSGIVYDSDENEEYKECFLKSEFLTHKYQDFQLIETILWENEKYFLLDLHLNRLKESSKYFDYYFNRSDIVETLFEEGKNFDLGKKYKVRLLLSKNGKVNITSTKLKKYKQDNIKIKLSDNKVDPENKFLYHKTTNREFYDKELKKAREEGFFDTIFTNKNGEVTEGCISNIVIKKNSKFYTPPITSGILNGVYRQYLLNKKDFPLEERIITKQNIFDANEIYLINSVRGMIKTVL